MHSAETEVTMTKLSETANHCPLLTANQTDTLSCSICETEQTHGKKVYTSTELATEVTPGETGWKKLLPFI